MQSLKKNAVDSVKWTTFQTLFSSIALFIFQIVKARYLSPKEFSYLAIIMISIGLFKTLENFGISQAIIQRDNINKEESSSLFIFNILFAILLAIIIYFLANFISNLFSLPRLDYYIKLTSIIILLNAPSLLYRAFLEKNLFFKEISLVKIINNILLIGSSIFFLALGFGLLSIIYGYLISTIVSTYLVFVFCKKYALVDLKYYFSLNTLYPFLRFGFFVSAKSMINFISIHIDEMVIGYFLAPETLGYYHFGKSVLVKLRSLVSASFNKVLFPVFSKLKKNNSQLCLVYQKISRYIAFISIPFFFGIALTAHLFVPLFFGEKWINSVIVFQVISIASIFAMLHANVSSSLLYAINKPNVVFNLEVIITSLYFFLLFIFASKGFNTIMIIYSMKILSMFLAFQYFANRYLSYSFFTYLYQLRRIIISGFFMVVSVVFLQSVVNNVFNQMIQLILSMLCGIVIYILCSFLLEKETIVELKSLIRT